MEEDLECYHDMKLNDNDINEDKLKNDIYDVMKKYFNGFSNTNHEVAKDFSLRELEDFISEYYNYLLK